MAFGRLERNPGARPMADINMTPLIDVMLVLLVIFMVTAPLFGSALKLDLPQARGSPPAGRAPVLALALDAEGRIFLDERALADADLAAALQAAAGGNTEAEVLLRADRRVPYGRVAELIAVVQQAGLSRIGFVTVPPPAPR
ncbi:ExbD/TolR family protein [Pseudorhodoferax sp.]|uniref:ExbD/TolR family protein n=1 Tax=Pseudorhodoferax sp. TaxID=1993553 RepID=UPI002DD6AAE3|nr:biopolymer transporter ExbD [Pseudorhodoferax sp.]